MFFLCSTEVNGQCAGNDKAIDVCDITNPASQNINLNLILDIGHTPGGTWKDDDKSGGFDKTTGILNAQLIRKSGVYHYTYTVTGVSGCLDNNAIVTVTIGGYTGVPALNSSICNANSAYNLFEAFNGSFLAPQSGGTWVGNTSSLGLTKNTLNATFLNYDTTYEYTYSIPAIGSCAAPLDAKVFVTIYRSPEPGIPTDLRLCSNGLSSYTNFNLNDLLIGEDQGGVWTEVLTDEIDNNDDTDSTVDIQNIYNTKGPGSYRFTYTVLTDNNVCFDETSNLDITIEKLLDYTGATLTLNAPICENEIATSSFSGSIQNVVNIPDGTYSVTYTISGNGSPITKASSFFNNVLTFPIDRSNFSASGDYTVTVTNIVSLATLNICNNIIPLISGVIRINPIPKINNATLTINPVCQNEDAAVAFSGTSNLSDGTYAILYNLTGLNIISGVSGVMNVIGGISSFLIPSGLIPKSGKTTVTITKITNTTTGCTNSSTLNKEFIVNPLPDVSNLAIAIKDVCQGQPATIDLTGLGTLTDISIDYTISGVNSVSTLTLALTVVGGTKSFAIPATDIPNVGLTTFTITKVTNVLTGCSITTLIPKDFTVNPIPIIPAAIDRKFCTSDAATVANLQPQGTQYQWFDSAVSTVPLISSAPLLSGNYFVKEVNALTKCESPLKMIVVQINTTPQINTAILTIVPICQGFNAVVNFSGTSNLADGSYDILYNLTGANIASAKSAILTITGGLGSFSIAANLIANAGNTTISITNITNLLTLCTNSSTLTKVFIVNAVPDVTNMVVNVKDGCLGQDVNVDITGLGTLTNISLNYSVNGANTIGSQTLILTVSGGKTNFLIPASLLSTTGSNTFIINNLTNISSSCFAVFSSPISKNFTINSIPTIPIAADQKFCETDLETVASLNPNGNQYKWYDSLSNSIPLASNKLLVSGTYYVKEANGTTGCESAAASINVLINVVPSPTLNQNGQEFCGIDKPTILNLSNNTNSNGNLTWYDKATNGAVLASSELLLEGTTYYGFNLDTNTNCYSNPMVATVTLTDCTATEDNFLIPDGFSPNGDGINETFQIVDIEFTFPNYTLEIYNRYGNLMFKGNINKPAWDGENSNSNFIYGDAPTGVYFYVINYNKDNLSPKQGQLYLNR
ncbi:Gliding motility-associated, C-terminal domain [Flavobacteriaceae bacterium]